MKIDGIAQTQRHAELRMGQLNLGDQGVRLVQRVDRPAVLAPDPAKLVADHDAEAEGMAAGVVLFADERKVDIANAMIGIEVMSKWPLPIGRSRGIERTSSA